LSSLDFALPAGERKFGRVMQHDAMLNMSLAFASQTSLEAFPHYSLVFKQPPIHTQAFWNKMIAARPP
jgi:hypothetical protein